MESKSKVSTGVKTSPDGYQTRNPVLIVQNNGQVKELLQAISLYMNLCIYKALCVNLAPHFVFSYKPAVHFRLTILSLQKVSKYCIVCMNKNSPNQIQQLRKTKILSLQRVSHDYIYHLNTAQQESSLSRECREKNIACIAQEFIDLSNLDLGHICFTPSSQLSQEAIASFNNTFPQYGIVESVDCLPNPQTPPSQ